MQKRRKTAPPTKETKKGGNEEPKQRDQKKLEETRQRRNEATRKRRNEETKKRGNEETTKRRNEETRKPRNEATKKGRNEEMNEMRNEDFKKQGEMKKWRTKKRGKEETKKHRRNEETHLCPTLLLAWGMSFWLNARHVSLMDFLWSRSTVVLWNHSLYACVLVQICSIALTCLSLTQILLLCVLLFVPISIVKVGLCTIIFCFHSVLSWSNLCPNTFAAIYVRVLQRSLFDGFPRWRTNISQSCQIRCLWNLWRKVFWTIWVLCRWKIIPPRIAGGRPQPAALEFLD